MKSLLRLLPLLIIGFALLGPYRAHASTDNKDRVTIVVLDQSGSMRLNLPEKKPVSRASDPNGLRCSAVRLLADLVTTRDSLGLVKLESHDDKTGAAADRTADILLAPLPMGTAEARDAFKSKVDCDHATNNTPIADALQKAYDQLAAVARDRGAQTFEGRVILLTDGDPQPQGQAQIAQITQLLPQFAQQSWAVSTIGLKLAANKNAKAIRLLQQIAVSTHGTYYGDVDEPLELQRLFVTFFAQQTGRALLPGKAEALRPNGESRITVTDYATRVDVLVAKNNPDATITLRQPGPDYAEVSSSGPGVALFSTDDKFYAAFSIEHPRKGIWSVRSNAPTNVIVNMLVESDLQIRLEQATTPRAGNQPLHLEARFYKHDGDAYTPITVSNATISADVAIQGRSYSLPLHDDGAAPDAAANDGLYTGELTPDQASVAAPTSANIAIDAQLGDAMYADNETLQLVAVPTIVLADDDGIVRVPPGGDVAVPLRLVLGKQPVALADWNVIVRQLIAGERRQVDVQVQDDTLIARLQPLPDDQQDYGLEVDLVGTGPDAGLERLRQPLQVRVIFEPTLKLYYTSMGDIPVGRPITISAALLKSFNTPMALSEPLQLNVEIDDDPAQVVTASQSDGKGMFVYTFIPHKPGRYRFTLLPPSNQPLKAVTQNVMVAAIPIVRWQSSVASDSSLAVQATQWVWLDRLRRLPLLGWPVRWLLPTYQSEPVRIEGTALRDDRPYAGALALTLIGEDGSKLRTETIADGNIATDWDISSGDYRVQIDFPEAFAPQMDCCRAELPLRVSRVEPLLDWPITIGMFGAEVLLLVIVGMVVRYSLAPKPHAGDRLIFTVGGRDQAVDLKSQQGFALLRPSRVNLTGYFRRRRWPLAGIVRVTRHGVELNGHSVPVGQSKSIDGYPVRYQPGRRPRSLRQPRPASSGLTPRAKRSMAGGGRARATFTRSMTAMLGRMFDDRKSKPGPKRSVSDRTLSSHKRRP